MTDSRSARTRKQRLKKETQEQLRAKIDGALTMRDLDNVIKKLEAAESDANSNINLPALKLRSELLRYKLDKLMPSLKAVEATVEHDEEIIVRWHHP